jgi:hypothetical protein
MITTAPTPSPCHCERSEAIPVEFAALPSQ